MTLEERCVFLCLELQGGLSRLWRVIQPVYVASALMGDSVHPCKCVPHLDTPCRVPYGGGEHEHRGRYATSLV